MVRHSEARAEVLGQEQDGGAVLAAILLGEVLDGVNQNTLSVNEARIVLALFSPAAAGIGHNRDGEDFSHENQESCQLRCPRNPACCGPK